jgi:hypothetical protein
MFQVLKNDFMKAMFLSILLIIMTNGFCQSSPQTFYIKSKGIYVNLKKNQCKVKVPFKEKVDIVFSVKNDTTAVIQEINSKKVVSTKQYRISRNYDSAFVKRYSVVNGKGKMNVEKVIFRTVE